MNINKEILFNNSDISYSGNTVCFSNATINKDLIIKLVNKMQEKDDIIIIFKTDKNQVSFSSKINTNQMVENIKLVLNEDDNKLESSIITSVFDLYLMLIQKKVKAQIGIMRNKNKLYYKIVTEDNLLQEAVKKVGITLNKNAFYFKSTDYISLKDLFNYINENYRIIYKNYKETGFINVLSIILYLGIDILSIAVGIFFLTH